MRSLVDAFSWCGFQLRRLGGHVAARDLASTWSSTSTGGGGATVSSAFSGIGAPEQALHGIQRYLAHHVPDIDTTVQQVAACDWNSYSRDELRHTASPPQHLYCDITEFVNADIRSAVHATAAAGKWTVDTLWATLSRPGATTLRAYCAQCDAMCTHPRAHVHVAGTPCIDHSTQPGAKRRGVLGASCVPLFTWIAMRHALQEPVCIHENVPGFDAGLLPRFLHISHPCPLPSMSMSRPLSPTVCYVLRLLPFYFVMTVILDLVNHGFPVRRRLRLTLCVHRSVIASGLTPMVRWSSAWVSQFKRQCLLSFHAFLDSDSDDESREHKRWARSRESRGGDVAVHKTKFATCPDVHPFTAVQALNPSELRRLRHYRTRWPSCVFSRAYVLGQDSDGCPTVSGSRTFQCQTRKQGIVFLDLLNRFVKPSEFLLMQGLSS